MKQIYNSRAIIVVALFLFLCSNVYAQPAGATISNAINWGTLSFGTTISDTKSNSPANGYLNNMGQSSDDIYYKFTLNASAEVNISHCASAFFDGKASY